MAKETEDSQYDRDPFAPAGGEESFTFEPEPPRRRGVGHRSSDIVPWTGPHDGEPLVGHARHRADLPTVGEVLLAVSDKHAPTKHRTAMKAAATVLESDFRGVESVESGYFRHCVSNTVTRTAMVDSLLSLGFGYVGFRIARSAKAASQRTPMAVIVPIVASLLPWTNLLLADNRLSVCEGCHLAVMANPSSRTGARMRRAYRDVYPESAVVLAAESVAARSDPLSPGGYDTWLRRAEGILPLVPREPPPGEYDMNRRPMAGGWAERPGAGPFGLPVATPSSYMRLPIAHADAHAALVERPERERQYDEAVHLDERVQSSVLSPHSHDHDHGPGAIEDHVSGVGSRSNRSRGPQWVAADGARRDVLGHIDDVLGFDSAVPPGSSAGSDRRKAGGTRMGEGELQ